MTGKWTRLGLILLTATALMAFLPMAFNNPVPINPYLNAVFPDEDPATINGQYQMVVAYPNLTFNDVSVITSAPNNDPNHPSHNLMFVGTVGGMIYAFDNNANVQPNQLTTVLDFTAMVYQRDETIAPTHPRDTWNHFLDGGLLNMVFHPEFGTVGSPNANYVYLQYCGRYNNNNAIKVSRFTVAYNPLRILPTSEQVLISVPKRGPSHYGGGMCFDNDGFFYVAFGDGMDPPFNNQANRDYFFNTVQGLDYFYGKVLRLDLEMDPSRSHAPTNFLTTQYGGLSGNQYWIPNDNPFNGVGGALEEIYTLGNRAPHRMTYDPLEDRIWEGEVGWNTREEVNIIQSGHNYQWPRFEGTLNNNQTFTNYNGTFATGTPQGPTWDMAKPAGRYAIIGGYVYRGNTLPGLTGKYICGLFGSGEIYALTLNPATGQSTRDILTIKAGDKEIHTFGLDQSGEIYAGGNNNDKIYRLESTNQQGGTIPATLSATGAFINLSNMSPAAGILPYEPKNPFWSDGAEKYRWIALPNDGDHNTPTEEIVFSADGNWSFPVGTVFIKHFEFETGPGVFQKVETRFLIQDKNSNYYGLSYRWRANQTDADLVGINGDQQTLNTLLGQHTWSFPSRNACLNCHNSSQGYVLGANTLQLNHSLEYAPGLPENQLAKWNSLGMFDGDIGATNIPNFTQMPRITDVSANLEDRARAYLEVNCAYCHNPNSGTPANFDVSYRRLLDETGLIYEAPGNQLGLPSPHIITPQDTARSVLFKRIHMVGTPEAMPPIAKARRDQAGIDLIAEWIMSMDPNYRPDPLKSGLVLHHKMNTNSGITSFDETLNANHGTRTNGALWTPAYEGSGLAFDGVNDQVIVPHDESLRLTNQLTLAAWVKVDNFGDWDGVITKGVNQSPYALQLWSNGAIRFTANWGAPAGAVGGGSWNSTGTLALNIWQHIALSYDGITLRFFINGALDSEVVVPGLVLGNGNENLVLGADLPGADEYFDGAMDEVRIYNKAVSANLIERMYYGNRPPTAAFAFSSAGTSNPLDYTFDATPSDDPDGNALTYRWNLGDGSSGIEPLFNHTFPAGGTYNVQLIVSDGEYQDTLLQSVSVNCTGGISFTPLVALSAASLNAGPLNTWQNTGNLGGIFTASGTPPSVQSIGGKQAVNFNGSQAMVSSILSPAGVTGNGDYSVMLEVWNPAIAGAETVFAWGHRGGPGGTNAQFMYGNSPTWGAIGHWGVADLGFDGGVPQAGVWHTIVYTYTGGTNGTESVYVDGVLNAQENKTLNIHAGQPFQIGAARLNPAGGFAEYFSGAIAQIKLFDQALSSTEVVNLQVADCEESAGLQMKLMLEGPYDIGSMTTSLSQLGHLSDTDPYGTNQLLAPGILAQTGNEAIVDWVWLELRDENDPTQIIAGQAAVLQKNGVVKSISGNNTIVFRGVSTGYYYVVAQHYNHLGVMTATALDLSDPPLIDLSDPLTPVFTMGGPPQKNDNGTMLLWAGDANGDGAINAVDNLSYWRLENGQPYQYGSNWADFNLDGTVNAVDRNLYWRINNSYLQQIP